MSDDVFYRVIDQAAEITQQPIRLHCDGEPTLHKKFMEYAHAVNSRGFEIALVSNGSKLRREYLDLRMGLAVNLSTGPDELAGRTNIDLDRYQKRLQEYVRLWLEEGADQSIFYTIYMSARQRLDSKHVDRTKAFVTRFLMEIGFEPSTIGTEGGNPIGRWFQARNKRGRPFTINVSSLTSGGAYPDLEAIPRRRELPAEFGFCDSAWKRLVVLADGKIQPCCIDLFGTLSYTDPDELFSHTLQDLWTNDSRISEIRERTLRGDMAHPTCRRCLDRLPSRELYVPFSTPFNPAESQ